MCLRSNRPRVAGFVLLTVAVACGTVRAIAQDGPILPVPVVVQDQAALDSGSWFSAAAAGDVAGGPGGDGRADLVVAQRGAWDTPGGDPVGPGRLLTFQGDGAGGFTLVAELAIAGDPTSLLLTDATGDGRPDALVTDGVSSTVTIYAGLGDGRFERVETITTGRTPIDAVLTDATGDGVADLLVCNYDHYYVGLHAGLPGGGFAPDVRINVGTRPVGMVVADIDGDGDADVVTANELSGDLSVAINDGGTFAEATSVGTLDEPSSIVAGDLSGDGLPEFIVADDQGTRLFTNTGGVLAPGPLVADTIYGQAQAVTLADFGGDGLLDLAAGTSSAVVVFGGDASAATGLADEGCIVALGIPLFDRSGGLVAAELSDAGPGADLVLVEGTRVAVALSAEDPPTGGTGAAGLVGPRTLNTERATARVAGEFTGDGIPDVLIAEERNSRLLIGLGDGAFSEPVDVRDFFASDLFAARLRPGDLDDVIVDASTILLLRPDGAGGFEPPIGLAGGARAMTIGDADGDGGIDVIVGRFSDLVVLLNDGEGNFSIAQTLALPRRPRNIDIGDVTGEGVADIIVSAADSGTGTTPFYVLPGLGGGAFDEAIAFDPGFRLSIYAWTIDVGDDRDAILLLRQGAVDLIRHLGTPASTRTTLLTTDDLVYHVDVLDIDGDGREDFTLSQPRGGLSIWRQDDESGFARVAGFGYWSQEVKLTDATGDGILDVLLGFGNLTALAIGRQGALPGCAADLDGDGRASVLDFLQFQNWFDAGDPRADIDGDGALTIFDFLRFQSVFALGC